MMMSIRIALLTGVIVLLLVCSCATVPTEPLAHGEVRLLSMHVVDRGDIKVNFPFLVNIIFEADGKPEFRTACFSFSVDGPYCYKVMEVNYGSPGTFKVQVRAKNTGLYALESYVYYIRDGKVQPTNIVNCHIRVIP